MQVICEGSNVHCGIPLARLCLQQCRVSALGTGVPDPQCHYGPRSEIDIQMQSFTNVCRTCSKFSVYSIQQNSVFIKLRTT